MVAHLVSGGETSARGCEKQLTNQHKCSILEPLDGRDTVCPASKDALLNWIGFSDVRVMVCPGVRLVFSLFACPSGR